MQQWRWKWNLISTKMKNHSQFYCFLLPRTFCWTNNFNVFMAFKHAFKRHLFYWSNFPPSSCLICLFFFIFAFHSICNANNKFLCLSSPIIPWPDSRLDVNFPRRRETTVNWVMLSNQRCCCWIWLNCDAQSMFISLCKLPESFW